jgi:2-polyprenyl-6-methoxyphenol hydroxylase-like FAD-dependent oxidoreductase
MANNFRNPASILVVGAGPVGLTMAAELARHGCRPRIIDKLTTPSPFCRAIGVTPRTLEVWEDMGIVRDMIDAGIRVDAQRLIVNGEVTDHHFDFSDLPYSFLGLPQYETERVLAHYLNTFGIEIERGKSLERLTQANGQVQTVLVDHSGRRLEAVFDYVIGCDGAHSTVRKALGIEFAGEAMPFAFVLADVHIQWELPRGMTLRALRPVPDSAPEMFIAIPLPAPGRYRVSTLAPNDTSQEPNGSDHGIQSERPAPGLEHFQAIADHMLPEHAVLSDLRWASTFRISMRLARHYQSQNVFLAGDAAHIHPPTGGQGMNTGIQDAYNLAWKLALVVKGNAKKTLLDSYEAERRPVGEDVIARTVEASMRLGREKGEHDRLADTQILVSYRGTPWVGAADATGGLTGPVAGDRAADCQGLRRQGVGFPLRLFELIRGTEHVLIASGLGLDSQSGIEKLRDIRDEIEKSGPIRAALIVDRRVAVGELPGVAVYCDAAGSFSKVYGAAPTAMLVRPDGYLAWRGHDCAETGLRDVLERTFLSLNTG